MNEAHKANQNKKRIKRIVKRLKDGVAIDRKEKLEARLNQLQ